MKEKAMHKIINGKKYDTKTANYIGHWSNGRSDGDYIGIDMYRKKTGEYFAAKQFGEFVSDIFYTEQLVPMGLNEAREWAESHLDSEEYEAEFGPVDDDGETVAVTVRISKPAKAILDRLAYGSSQSSAIESLLMGAEG